MATVTHAVAKEKKRSSQRSGASAAGGSRQSPVTSRSSMHNAQGRTPRTRCSVAFSFLGRDFYNALSEKDAAAFGQQLLKYLGGFVVGIPVFVYADYLEVRTRSCR